MRSEWATTHLPVAGQVLILAFILAALTAGCAGNVKTLSYGLAPKAGTCQVTEARPSWFSTSTSTVCWDENGKPIGFANVRGEPVIELPISIIGASGTVLGAGVLSYGLTHIGIDAKLKGNGIVGMDQGQLNQLTNAANKVNVQGANGP